MKRFIIISLQIVCSVFSLFILTVSNAPAVLNDMPIDNYSFKVEIGDFDIGSIISVEDLSLGITVDDSENENISVAELKDGRVEIGVITLTKRFIANSIFNDWIEKALKGDIGNINQHRKNITITLIGHSMIKDESIIIQRWILYGCLPTVWRVSTLSMASDGELTEHLSVACARLEEVSQF